MKDLITLKKIFGLIRSPQFLTLIAASGSGVIVYIFQVLAGRFLSVPEYGAYNAYSAAINMYMLVLPQALTLAITKSVASSVANRQPVSNTIIILTRYSGFIVTLLMITAVFMFIVDNRSNTFYFVMILAVTTLICFPSGMAQGTQMILLQTIIGLFASVFRPVVLTVLHFIGISSTTGALLSLLISIAIGLICTSIAVCIKHKPQKDVKLLDGNKSLKALYALALIIIANLIFSYFINADMLLIRVLFNESKLGIYGAANTVFRLQISLAGALSVFVIPRAVTEQKNRHSSIGVFVKYMVAGLGLMLVFGVIATIFARPYVLFFFGKRYLEAVRYIAILMLAGLPLGSYYILFNYCIAVARLKVFVVTGIILVTVSVFGILSFSFEPIYVIMWLALFVTLHIAIIMCCLGNEFKKQKRLTNK